MEEPNVPARNRIRTLFALSVATILLLAACKGAEPQNLLVLEWSGYEAEDFWTDFKPPNADAPVTFEFGISDADILAKMEAGSQADLFHFYSGWQQFYVDGGLVQGIGTSQRAKWDKGADS